MPSRSARVRAHAKINLGLKVLGKRQDGYHELRTVFQTIGLHDVLEVEFERAKRTEILLDSATEIADNLVVRASRLFLETTRISARVRFRLVKRIPMGAGLGGGSSDAAAALLTLSALSGKSLSLDSLFSIGRQLGSDVSFFLVGGTALGLGRGEELYPLPEMPASPALVVAPPVHVSTAQAYRDLRRGLTSGLELPKLNVFQSFVWRESSVPVAENDFEDVVFRQYPELRRWLRQLKASGAALARMSGSGSSLFGIYESALHVRQAMERFPEGQLKVYSTRLVTRSQYRASWWRSLREHLNDTTWPPHSRYSG